MFFVVFNLYQFSYLRVRISGYAVSTFADILWVYRGSRRVFALPDFWWNTPPLFCGARGWDGIVWDGIEWDGVR